MKHSQQFHYKLEKRANQYVGSIVLGLNDALVELTGALAGLTLAFQNTRLVAIAGLITGIAAAFSMAASEYLSIKAEGSKQHPYTAAVFTGIAYIGTVLLLVLPYFILSQPFYALGWTLLHALGIIIVFSLYISHSQKVSFSERFFEMAFLSFGVAFLTFLIGYVIRIYFNIEV